MKQFKNLFLLLESLSFFLLTMATSVRSQSISIDGTTPTTPNSCSGNCTIGGGLLRENNLFHSFANFNVDPGATVDFIDPGVTNILTRITGNNPSNINGTLGVLGNANLFLINPHGIIFGENASLNLDGSFVATTANGLQFGNESFLTNTSAISPLLTINPTAFLFQGNNGTITNSGNLQVDDGKSLVLLGGNIDLLKGSLQASGGNIELGGLSTQGIVNLNTTGNLLSLNFPNNGTRSNISINNSTINVMAKGGGNLVINGNNLSINNTEVYTGIFGVATPTTVGGDIDINLTGSLNITDSLLGNFVAPNSVGNGGNILINAQSIFTKNAQLLTRSFGRGNTGNISIFANDSITFTDALSLVVSQVESGAVGNGGTVDIQGSSLFMNGGAQIGNSIKGRGNAGNIQLNITNNISLDGQDIDGFSTAIQSLINPGAVGNGGTINITTGSLSLTNGAQIATPVLGSLNGLGGRGNGGDIIIKAKDSINISGSGQISGLSSGIFAATELNAIGQAGDIILNTNNFNISNGGIVNAQTLNNSNGGNVFINTANFEALNGGQILTSSGFSEFTNLISGNAGNIVINASNSVNISGFDSTYDQRVSSFGPRVQNENSSSGFFANSRSNSTGLSGDITVNTPQLNVSNNAKIAVDSRGTGNAGQLNLRGNRIILNNNASLSAESVSGGGGNININLSEYLLMRNNSLISTTAGTEGGGGDGGNINIISPFIVAPAQENSDIIANAFLGNGGNINITATGLYGIKFRDNLTSFSDITASSQFGQSGIVDINSPDVDVSQGLVDLPTNPIDTSKLIAQNICNEGKASEFIVTGKGGLPPNPTGILTQETIIVDLGESLSGQNTENNNIETLNQIKGWQVTNNGDIFLTETTSTENLIVKGREYYEIGEYKEAIKIWTQVEDFASQSEDNLTSALILNNISVAYIQLGEWQKAKTNLNLSWQILQSETDRKKLGILAQILNTKANLEFVLGQSETALNTWLQAEKLYSENNDELGIIGVKINQAQALQRLGLNLQSVKILTEVEQKLQRKPDSKLKLIALKNYSDSLRLIGKIEESKLFLEQSLTIAQNLGDQENVSQYYFSLGNLYYSNQREDKDLIEAIEAYHKVLEITNSPILKIQSELNLLNLLIYRLNNNPNIFGSKRNSILSEINNLVSDIDSNINKLVNNRGTIYTKINYVATLGKLNILNEEENINDYQGIISAQNQQIIPILERILEEAQISQDHQAQAYILGYLGEQYEAQNQLEKAQELTRKAIIITEEIKANDIAYRWQSNLGRILKAQGKKSEAITSYSRAYNILKTLRSDLVIVNKDLQYSFRESVEPIYRDFVSLLLEDQPSQSNLQQALEIMESLQIAELDNFFQDACSTVKTENINQVAVDTAVLYPIILPDRLDLILSLPGQNLKYYSSPIAQDQLESTIRKFKSFLTNNRATRRNDYLPLAQELYDLLIRKTEPELVKNNIKTLAFVLDGSLRNIPMAVLNNGEQFLIEKYAVALSPGLKLLEPRKLPQAHLSALLGGLTEARQGFNALPNVDTELEKIGTEITNDTLLNQNFTYAKLQEIIKNNSFPIIHLATHGEFSSQAEDTFILTYDNKINAKELEDLLSSGNNNIELLVLSACRTAAGDNRAALGLAGIAVRAGARSTLATLWYVDDKATSELMIKFYEELQKPNETKAEALRQAQIALLTNPDSSHPLYWAPYVLVGNWL